MRRETAAILDKQYLQVNIFLRNMMYPVLRKDRGLVSLYDTIEGRRVKEERRNCTPIDDFEKERERAVRACEEAGGDPGVEKDWMGFLRMQWGLYRGETYRWMITNNPGYCRWLVDKINTEGFEDKKREYQLRFKQFVSMFPEGCDVISWKASKTVRKVSFEPEHFKSLEVPKNISEEIAPSVISEQVPGPSSKSDAYLTRSSLVTSIPITIKWKKTLPVIDQEWISKTFFHFATRRPQFDFNRVAKLWYEPPQPSISRGVLNKQECYFGHRIFLWMPSHLFRYQFICPYSGCQGALSNQGVHEKTRMVLDTYDFYIIAGEDYECNKCKRRIISWSQGILDQMDLTERSMFPCILTERYACDLKVVRLMRQRALGNSSSLVRKQIAENHGENYLDKCRQYAANQIAIKKATSRGLVTAPAFVEPPKLLVVPGHCWFMNVYQLDVISRLDYELAELTSVSGDILKIDSTKKVTNKLAGSSRGTAMWATNVGNEHGQILMSVLTEDEGEGLKKMLDGIILRYRLGGISPPKVLYTDRDCCGNQCIKKYFDAWPFLQVRLDAWHFIRRFANGCTTDKHQLYGPFMARLSSCIFKIDEADYALLMRAKRNELVQRGFQNLSDSVVAKHITSSEVGRHCKHATRGTNETMSLISQLMSSLDGEKGLDSSGVPVIDSVKMADIWEKQLVHVPCLQDPQGVKLFLQTSTIKMGGIDLPVYKCARGSTSLEHFHLHMTRFIPGTLASDTSFQVYMLDGIFRWNADRAVEAVADQSQGSTFPKSYNGPLKHHTNMLWQELCGVPLFPNYKPPAKYTGELVGIQYLYDQTGKVFPSFAETRDHLEMFHDTDLQIEDEKEDEGFVELDYCLVTPPEENFSLPAIISQQTTTRPILNIPTDAEYREMAMETPIYAIEMPKTTTAETHIQQTLSLDNNLVDRSSEVAGPDNVSGYNEVMDLAEFLVKLREVAALRFSQIQRLIYLWSQLSEYDKMRTRFPRRYTKKHWSGKNFAQGVESIAKIGLNQGPTQRPNCNRYTEATCKLLLKIYPGDQKHEGRVWTRWQLVLRAFHNIRKVILNCPAAIEKTGIQLPILNKKTLQQWYNKQVKTQKQKVLLQGLDMRIPEITGNGIPEAQTKLEALPTTTRPKFECTDLSCKVDLSKKRRPSKRKAPLTESVTTYPVIMNQQQLLILPPLLASPTPPKKSRSYTIPDTIKCRKCGENRKNSTTHKSYMFHIYCQAKESIPFDEWKNNIKQTMEEKKKIRKSSSIS